VNIVADLISGTILFAVPLLLVALGGMFSERSGVINIALEGIMIVGALFSCLYLRTVNIAGAANHAQGHMIAAMVVSVAAGGLYSLLLAVAAINLKANQTIGGTALNLLAPAFAIVLTWVIQGQGQTTIPLPDWRYINHAPFVFQNPDGFWASLTLFLDRIVFKSLYITTPAAILVLVLAQMFLYKTKTGLRLRACGEHPQAADALGVNVYKMRYLGVFISGCLGGLGGFAYTLAAGSGFQSTVAGYGFLALAVMIFGNWKPLNILGASLFFAFFRIISSYASSLPFLPKFENIKSKENLYLMLPYIVTMIVLVLTSGKSRAPKAEGIPYDQGKR